MVQPVLTCSQLTAAAEREIRKYSGDTVPDDFGVQAKAQSAQMAVLRLWRDLSGALIGQASDEHGLRVQVEADDARLENILIPF